MSDRTVTSPRRDDGFTLIELMVAIGIFGILMALVSVMIANGLQAIRKASTANIVQAQQQNALLVLTRDIKYIDNPVNSRNPPAAILQATPTTMVFYSVAGAGTVDRLPYKTLLCTTTRGVESIRWVPALTNGAATLNTSPNMTVPACTDAGTVGATRRVLLPNENDTAPTIGFRYWRERTAADGAGTGDIELVPNGALTTAQLALLDKVTVTLTDPALGAPLEQTITLVNDR